MPSLLPFTIHGPHSVEAGAHPSTDTRMACAMRVFCFIQNHYHALEQEYHADYDHDHT